MKKLSNRLQKINDMIISDYQSIWDCCCDHGLLGLTLLKRKAAATIHFVDIVPSLTTALEVLLQKHFSTADYAQRWQVHCIDVTKLPLTTNKKQVIIIAGIGGELVIQFINSIICKFEQNLPQNMPAEIEFILCPVHHNYQLRHSLITHNVNLLNECIVEENQRFYEVIHVSKTFNQTVEAKSSLKKVSATGDTMWDLSTTAHQQYLTKTINHYQRMLLAATSHEKRVLNHIISQYSELNVPIEK